MDELDTNLGQAGGDSDAAPVVEEAFIWLSPEEEPFPAEVRPALLSYEPFALQSFEPVMSIQPVNSGNPDLDDSTNQPIDFSSEIEGDVSCEPVMVVCEPFKLDGLELEMSIPPEKSGLSEPDGNTIDPVMYRSEVEGGDVYEEVMLTTGSPSPFQAPVTTGGRTVREDSRDLNLRKRQHEGAQHGELSGSKNLNLVGNRLDNELTGNEGNNRIFGRRGIDRCTGGAGQDSFVLIAKGGTHYDWLTDFDSEDDKLLLRGRGLSKLFSEGELREGVLGDSLIWNDQDKALMFDPDSPTGARSPIMLAIIPGLEAQNVTADLFLPG